jgi:hypothetical protein
MAALRWQAKAQLKHANVGAQMWLMEREENGLRERINEIYHEIEANVDSRLMDVIEE